MYGRVLSTITHETETTCMYFWSLMSNYKLRERSLTSNCAKLMRRSSLRTQAVVEAQQHALESYAARAMRNLNIGAGSMRARRIIEDMIEAEARNAAA